ncbi:MAG: biosynthetic-type acetolactate synthase large subunit, partial [Corynebacterium sp.]|nr:biosynthetic-type acetolactate synthase large subunit [Corynebacterium sp.]
HSFIVTDANKIPEIITAAFHLAGTGRPGPVLVDIPKDVQNAPMEYSFPPKYELPGYKPTTSPHPRQISAAVELIAQSSRPVLYVGGGVIKAGAAQELLEFADFTGIPVVTTLMARGSFPDSHPQHMGMPGMHGSVPAVAAMQRADVIIAVGARFDDRVTGDVDSFAPNAKIIHADIDPAEIGKICEAAVPIVGDAREVLMALTRTYQNNTKLGRPEITKWMTYLHGMQDRFPRGWEPTEDGKLNPQFVIEKISEVVGPDAVYVSGVGQHQMWSAQFIDFEKPRTWINSGGAGTMGYSIPAALGAKAAVPEKEVWAIDGDGCFQMTNQELTTATVEGFPLKVAVINNGNLGMVRQWQTLFYEKNYSNTKLRSGEKYIPDFVQLAQSMGCETIRVTTEEEVVPAIERAREINDRPVVIDFIVGEDAQVWPMIAGGASNEEVQYALGLRPLFDEDSAAEDPADIQEAVEEAQE